MTPSALYDLFRSDMSDQEQPYLWTDDEVWDYMDDAYSMFVRLRGGIPDATSNLTKIAIAAGEAYSKIDPRIMKIRRVTLVSNGLALDLKNVEDTPLTRVNDYGTLSPAGYDTVPGQVRCMVIGEEEGLVRWISVPAANDTAKLVVYRLPLNTLSEDSGDTDMDEVQPHHHRHFLKWMKHRAYDKQDAETFNRGRSDDEKAKFEAYCLQAKGELDRQKSKTRIVAYGGY